MDEWMDGWMDGWAGGRILRHGRWNCFLHLLFKLRREYAFSNEGDEKPAGRGE